MRSRGTPEQGRDLGSVLWALRWTQRLRGQLVQCEAPRVLIVEDLKETGSQNLGHPEAWACFRQCGRPGARTSRTWWPLGTPARAAAGWASPVWVSGLRAPGCGGHGRPLCPACCRPWTCPTPQVLLALGLMRDCAVAETRGPGGPRGGGQRLLPPSRGASEARTSVTRPGAVWRVPCLPRGARVSPCVGRPPALPAGPGKWSPHGASRVLCRSRPRPAGPPWGEAQAAV